MNTETLPMNKPVLPISVVVPCFRCEQTIQRAIKSIAGQTQTPREVLLVDDASDDNTFPTLLKLQNQYEKGWIHVIRLEQNSGPSVARNAGWEAATQPYIAFLDADDAWHPRKLEIQYGWMQTHPHVVMTGHTCRVVRETPNLALSESWCALPVKPYHLLLCSGAFGFPTPSIIVRRSLAIRFEPGKRRSEDYLFKLQTVLGGHATWRLEIPLVYLYKARYGERGQSADLWKMEKGQLDTYWRLRTENHIGWSAAVSLSVISFLKYVYRMILVQLRRFKKNRN